MLAPYLLVLALAAPASAAPRTWRRVLTLHHVAGRSADVYLAPRALLHRHVKVTVGVRRTARDGVAFADALYGATAWAYRHGRWRRVDSAEVRAAFAPLVQPGHHAVVTLPLKWHARRVRVLIRVPADHRAVWTDVQ
jgi:hypothetical protein